MKKMCCRNGRKETIRNTFNSLVEISQDEPFCKKAHIRDGEVGWFHLYRKPVRVGEGRNDANTVMNL
jgi:hypothetical protein